VCGFAWSISHRIRRLAILMLRIRRWGRFLGLMFGEAVVGWCGSCLGCEIYFTVCMLY